MVFLCIIHYNMGWLFETDGPPFPLSRLVPTASYLLILPSEAKNEGENP